MNLKYLRKTSDSGVRSSILELRKRIKEDKELLVAYETVARERWVDKLVKAAERKVAVADRLDRIV